MAIHGTDVEKFLVWTKIIGLTARVTLPILELLEWLKKPQPG